MAARTDTLSRIAAELTARRDDLRKQLGLQLADLAGGGPTGDPADAAFGHAGEVLTAHLVEAEARELAQVEQALLRIQAGEYGSCAGCGGRIPTARLDALPFSTLCVGCQRQAEADRGWAA